MFEVVQRHYIKRQREPVKLNARCPQPPRELSGNPRGVLRYIIACLHTHNTLRIFSRSSGAWG